MKVKGQENRVFRSSDWTRRNQDGEREGKESVGLTDFKRS